MLSIYHVANRTFCKQLFMLILYNILLNSAIDIHCRNCASFQFLALNYFNEYPSLFYFQWDYKIFGKINGRLCIYKSLTHNLCR